VLTGRESVLTLIGNTPETAVEHLDYRPTEPNEPFSTRFSRIDWLYEICFLVALLGTATFALSLAGRRSGWPIGQTPPDAALVQIYAAHFRHGDIYPVWSSSDAFGMGTPVVLYYQRLFFMVGGVVFLILGGSLKATLVVTLAVFMIIGGYGVRTALGVVTKSRMIRIVGAIGFLVTNWAFSEWLIRGDLAEFSAMMVVPWLIYWCLTVVKYQRISWSLVPIMVALIWAHNTAGLISVVMLAVTGAVFLIFYGLGGMRRIALKAVLVVGATVAVLAPGLVAEVKMGGYYDPATTIIHENSLIRSFSFAHPWAFVFNPGYHWLAKETSKVVPFGLDIQLDFAVTLLLVLGLFALAYLTLRKVVSGSSTEVPRVDPALVSVLFVSLALYLVFQFRISLPLWNAFWQLKVVGYPFRMMTFAVPLALILAMVVSDWYLRLYRTRRPGASRWIPGALAVAWLASLFALSPVTGHLPASSIGPVPNYPFFPIKDLTEQPNATFRTSTASWLFTEYLPKVRAADGRGQANVARLYQQLHQTLTEASSLSSTHCSITEVGGRAFESLRVTYRVTCNGRTDVALPISYSPFTGLDESSNGKPPHPIRALHIETDPRIVIHVQTGGTYIVVAHLPTLMGILF
jgi:hypothetical protein